MGLEPSKSPKVPVSAPVILHIYDMGTDPEVQAMNRVLKMLGTGAFHCGVEVYDREWSFRGTRPGFEGTGVFWCRPRKCNGHSYRESLDLGISHLSEDEVFRLIGRLQTSWPGKRYDLLRQNCCHFVDTLARCLGVNGLPPWLTSLAGAGAAVADTTDYVEQRSKSLASGVSVAMHQVKDGVVTECTAGFNTGCVSNVGCMSSFCERNVSTRVYAEPEIVDAEGEFPVVKQVKPTIPVRESPQRRPHSQPRPMKTPARIRSGYASKTQCVPHTRTGCAHSLYLPRQGRAWVEATYEF
mmetsp:Transcript_53302/g.158996  ORF Transcript_53302/g.158996 Transcript_53302/m.158996 type:complete len:297 (-) Transcript_53302:77-967(-)